MLKISKFIALLLACICLSSVVSKMPENNLKFLDEREQKLKDINVRNIENFIEGFFSGIEVFDNVVRNSTCLQNGEGLVREGIELFNLLKDFKVDIHVISNVQKIVSAIEAIANNLKSEKEQCKNAGEIAFADLYLIIDRITRPGYMKEIVVHLYQHLGDLDGFVQNAFSAYNDGNMSLFGNYFGQAMKLILFWDLRI